MIRIIFQILLVTATLWTSLPLLAHGGSKPAEAIKADPSKVPPVDWSEVSIETVDDQDLYYYYQPHPWAAKLGHSLAYYLGHFHRLANAVRMDGPNRGFIDLHVWRQGPFAVYNARIMESILSLAWFYTKDEPWNPYYGSAALRLRMEEAMRFWIGSQDDKGRFSEYGEKKWNLPGTAFACKFMSETMVLLEKGPPIDNGLHSKLRESLRKAIMFTLHDGSFWRHGRSYTNQYTNIFAAALAYLYLYEDKEMEVALERQMRAASAEFVSPAGYLYEKNGPDWGYYFGTDHSNFQMIWHYGQGRTLSQGETIDGAQTFGDLQKSEYRRTTEWVSYNAVPQPDGKTFVLNRAIATRNPMAAFERIATPLAEVVPLARAFNVTKRERQQRLRWCRRQLEREWGDPPPLEIGTHMGFSPYAFLHRNHRVWYPTEEQRLKAFEQLPFIADQRFVHQRVDNRRPQVFTYIRRPSYYMAFNDTALTSPHGIGLIWHPEYGALLQSHSDYERFAWGAFNLDEKSLYEGKHLNVAYFVDGSAIEPQAGVRNLPDGDFEITYTMDAGKRRLRFEDDYIHVSAEGLDGKFVEQIPLLLAEKDKVEIMQERQRVQIKRGGESVLAIEFENAKRISLREGNKVDSLRSVVVDATASKGIKYRLCFSSKKCRK